MKKFIIINKKLESFSEKNIKVSGDKSLSIRFVILSSLAHGVSNAQNILKSEDVISAIRCIRKLGIKINVGPNSAGAIPGPACYGLGGPATITDCNLVLGYIQASNFPKIFGKKGKSLLNINAPIKALKIISLKVTIKSVEKECGGLERFVPASLTESMKKKVRVFL